MSATTATLARLITRASSKQSYLTARLLADREMIDDCYRAYAYFRWADDVVDETARSKAERVLFIERQKTLIDRLYRNYLPDDLQPEEEIIADLISHDRGDNPRLRSYICNFMAILEFDAQRKGRLISQKELNWYSDCLGKAITDSIQYFIGHNQPYPTTRTRYRAATAAHITHMLRDMMLDTPDGYINIPREYLVAHNIGPKDVDSDAFRTWVKARVALARQYFQQGKQYLDELDLLRCKIAGYWYCARFEVVLDAIECDDYILRLEYNERHSLKNHLKMAWLGVIVTCRHFARRTLDYLWLKSKQVSVNSSQ